MVLSGKMRNFFNLSEVTSGLVALTGTDEQSQVPCLNVFD